MLVQKVKRPRFREELRRAAKRQLQVVESLGDAAHLETEDAVHDLRVALRRLRSLWRIAQNEGDKEAKALRGVAKELAASLGAARDLDVLMIRVQSDVADGVLSSDLADPWLDQLAIDRKSALDETRRILLDEAFAHWKQRAEDWAESKSKGPTLDAILPSLISHQAHTVFEASAPKSTEEGHQLRIEVKRLRYLLEFFAKDMEGMAETIAALTAIQDAIGDDRDRLTAAGRARAAGLEDYADHLGRPESTNDERPSLNARSIARSLLKRF